MNSASRTRRSAARIVEDYFHRVYERSGTRGLLTVGFGATTVCILVITPAILLTYDSYDDGSVKDVAPFAASGTALVLLGLLIGLLATWPMIRVLLEWTDGSPSPPDPLAVWDAALAAPRVLALRGSIAVFVMLVVNLTLIYRGLDLAWAAFAPNAVVNAILVATGGFAAMLFLEYTLRPVTADVARSLPPEFEPEQPRLALHTKAILPIPGVVIYTSLLVASAVDTHASLPVRTGQGLGSSIVVGLVAVALYYVLAHAFLDPIDQLTAATQRVQAGDLHTRVPVVSGDEFGGLAFSFNRMLDGLQERESLREHNVELAGALEESLEEVRASRSRIVAAADEERRRMERDLHDGAQQRLVMISLKLAMAAELLTKDPAAAAALHDELRADAARAVDELRDLAHGIYPPLLESDGLAAALEDIADQSALPITIASDGAGRYPAPVEAAIYFCCLEALQNAAKYAGADCRASIRLSETGGILHFVVADDGQGFDTSGVNGTAGLQNMADRIGALGGALSVRSERGTGTRIEGRVPV